jgi:adenylate cyclase
MLDQRYITPQWAWAWVLVPCLLIALLYLIWPWRSTKGLLLWTALTGLVVLVASVFFFVRYAWWLPLSPMPMMVALLGVLGLVLESLRLNQQLRVVAHQFSRFIPESLVKRLIRGRVVGPSSDKRELTVLVADMRGFTGASEGKSPEAVAELAQRCLDTLTQAVYQYGGTIEKYSGDGLMAIWGAPHHDPLHAQHAVEAGVSMQQAIAALAPWFIEHDFKPMKVSVGINTGEMAVGVFGGDAHLAWTAHGDAVNVASRIEQLTRTVNEDLLLGWKTAELYGLDKLKYCGDHYVKGRHGLVAVYSL